MDAVTRSTCPYCGVGCGVLIETTAGQVTGVRGDPEHPANFGRLCTKGSTLHLTALQPAARAARLLEPRQRATRGGPTEAMPWDDALDQVADRFAGIVREHGPDAVGFYISGQLLTEDYYVFNKLAKGVIGTNNIDTNSRLCMSSAVAGYKQTLGADAPPACYDDLAQAACLFITGSNTAWAHPILYRRIEDARRANPAQRMIVVDPRRTETAAQADLHLAIQPGTDVMLYHGMLHLMLWEGWIDAAYIAAHTTGFDALKAQVRDCTPALVARTCGIDAADLLQATRWFAGVDTPGGPAARQPTLSLYCQGLNQSASGTARNTALINLHLATGQIGRAGAGPFSLTGQPNAMGGREVGGMANLLSAHRDLANPAHRDEVAALWSVPRVPERPGKTAVEMFQAAADGEIRALWIACTNPAQSMPDQATVRRALERCEFVVVQEAYATAATCAFADLLLPATSWGEKDGTVTNSERRISRVRPAIAPPGEARHDWSIVADAGRRIARRLGVAESLMAYDSPEAIWNEHRESTRGRDLDITGLSYARLEAAPRQWPFVAGASEGRARLYEDGVFPTPDGRARFVTTPWRAVAEPREARFPFSLTTGRLRDHWHGMTRTGTLGRLFAHVAEPEVQMHPHDMARRQIRDGDLVHVTSRRGSLVLPARGSESVGASQAFIAMHWGSEHLGGQASTGGALAGINALTSPVFCPDSRQPELKHTAVKILKAELPWSLLAMAWLPADAMHEAQQALRALLPAFAYATCVPFAENLPLERAAGERQGLLLRAAAGEAPTAALLDAIEAALGLAQPDTLRYRDARRQQHRAARLVRAPDGAVTLQGFLLGGDTSAEAWVTELLRSGQPAQTYGRLVLAPGVNPPQALVPRGAAVCSCFGVDAHAITRTLAHCAGDDDARLASLQQQLRCGTNCGSCLPELRRLVRSTPTLTGPTGSDAASTPAVLADATRPSPAPTAATSTAT